MPNQAKVPYLEVPGVSSTPVPVARRPRKFGVPSSYRGKGACTAHVEPDTYIAILQGVPGVYAIRAAWERDVV
jgi:hypothetical protein